jgi:hypothetical protein
MDSILIRGKWEMGTYISRRQQLEKDGVQQLLRNNFALF